MVKRLSFSITILMLATSAPFAHADERVGLAYSWVDDGSCSVSAQVAELSYRLSGDEIDVAGKHPFRPVRRRLPRGRDQLFAGGGAAL